MLSLSQLRDHIFPLFKVMDKTGMVVEVAHKGTVYHLYVKRTDKPPALTRAKRERPAIDLSTIDTKECPDCGALMFSGTCMNTQCPSVVS